MRIYVIKKVACAIYTIEIGDLTGYHNPKMANRRKPKPAAPLMAGVLGAAAPFAVDVPEAAVVVYVLVLAGMVVPGIDDPGLVVAGSIVLVPETLAAIVSGATVEGSIVVPGKVVVTVTTWPSAVAGIALPEPAAVYCVGMGRVEVFGLSGEPSDP